MRIAVLGAGAMGSWFGGRLALAGSEVQLLTTNAAHREAVRANGLVLRSAAGERTVRLPIHAPADLAGPVDLVLLLTKSFQSDEAMASVRPALDATTVVLSLQNGLGNAATIARHVPEERVLIGVSMMPVDRVAPGIVASTGEGVSWFGHAGGGGGGGGSGAATSGEASARPGGGASSIVPQVLDAFAPSGMDVRFDERIHRRVWEKVAFNAGMNASCALSGGTPGDIGRLAEARELTREVAREVAAVGASRGIPIDLDAVFATIDYACAHHGDHKASMRQDLEAGRRTELSALNGAVVALSADAGVPVPLNRVLATLVRLAECSRQGSA